MNFMRLQRLATELAADHESVRIGRPRLLDNEQYRNSEREVQELEALMQESEQLHNIGHKYDWRKPLEAHIHHDDRESKWLSHKASLLLKLVREPQPTSQYTYAEVSAAMDKLQDR